MPMAPVIGMRVRTRADPGSPLLHAKTAQVAADPVLLDRDAVIAALAKLGQPKIGIGGGAAMVLHGMRLNTRDLDLDAPTDVFDQLHKQHNQPPIGKSTLGSRVFTVPGTSIDIHEGDPAGTAMEGVQGLVETPEQLLKFYQKLNREKDQQWIEVLKARLTPTIEIKPVPLIEKTALPKNCVTGAFSAALRYGARPIPHISDEGFHVISQQGNRLFHYTTGPGQGSLPWHFERLNRDAFIRWLAARITKQGPLKTTWPSLFRTEVEQTAAKLNKTPTKTATLYDEEEKQSQAGWGIPDMANYGKPHEDLTPGQLVKYVLQQHETVRKPGHPHYDLRLGTPDTGLFSWAVPKASMPEPGQKRLAAQTQVHDYGYGDFTGRLGRGYGHGNVTMADKGQALVTKVTPNTISFTVAHARRPHRYSLIRIPQEKLKVKEPQWILIGVPVGHKQVPGIGEKPVYKLIHANDLDDAIAQATEIQAKIDGAHTIYDVDEKGKLEAYSIRPSVTGEPIVHTERLGLAGIKAPELRKTTLRGEAFATDESGKAVPFNILSGLLNANVARSLEEQQKAKLRARNALFGVVRYKGEHFTGTPDESRAMLEQIIQKLPQNHFELPAVARTPEEKQQLLEAIRTGKHPETQEGIVLHVGDKLMKYKLRPEVTGYLQGTYPGLGKRKSTAGGLLASLTPEGPGEVRLGTGFTDPQLLDIVTRMNELKGTPIRIEHQGRFPATGLLRAPSFKGFETDKPLAKTAAIGRSLLKALLPVTAGAGAAGAGVYVANQPYHGDKDVTKWQYLLTRERLRHALKRFKLGDVDLPMSTGLHRIGIPINKLNPGAFRYLDYVPSHIAIPESGQVNWTTYRNVGNRTHIHQHPQHWMLHKDTYTPLQLAFRAAERKNAGKPLTVSQKFKAVGTGLRHLFTEGMPGLGNYLYGRMLGMPKMEENLEALKQHAGDLVETVKAGQLQTGVFQGEPSVFAKDEKIRQELQQLRNDFWAKHIYRTPVTEPLVSPRLPEERRDTLVNVVAPGGKTVQVNVSSLGRDLGIAPGSSGKGPNPLPENLRLRIQAALGKYQQLSQAVKPIPDYDMKKDPILAAVAQLIRTKSLEHVHETDSTFGT